MKHTIIGSCISFTCTHKVVLYHLPKISIFFTWSQNNQNLLEKKKMHLWRWKKKQKNCFTGGQTSKSVGFFFKQFFKISGGKITLKTWNFRKNLSFCCKNFLGKFSDFSFNIFQKKYQILVRKWLILQDFGKSKKKK